MDDSVASFVPSPLANLRSVDVLETSESGFVVREHLMDPTDGITQLPLYACEAE